MGGPGQDTGYGTPYNPAPPDYGEYGQQLNEPQPPPVPMPERTLPGGLEGYGDFQPQPQPGIGETLGRILEPAVRYQEEFGELAFGPPLRGEGFQPQRFLNPPDSPQLREAWHETPEPFPGFKGALEVLAPDPTDLLFGTAPLAIDIARGAARPLIKGARGALTELPPVGRELLAGEVGAVGKKGKLVAEPVQQPVIDPDVLAKFQESHGTPEFYTPETKIPTINFTKLTNPERTIVSTVGGKPAWSDGHMLEMGTVPDRLKGLKTYSEIDRMPEVGKPSMFDAIVPDYSTNGQVIIPRLKSTLNGEKTMLTTVLTSPDHSLTVPIQAKYIDYFSKRYPDAVFIGRDKNSPILVQSQGKTVGVVMPVFPDPEFIDNSLNLIRGTVAKEGIVTPSAEPTVQYLHEPVPQPPQVKPPIPEPAPMQSIPSEVPPAGTVPPKGPPIATGGLLPAPETLPIPPSDGGILGLRPITPYLTKTQELLNVVRQTVGKVVKAIPETPESYAAIQERARLKPIVDSMAAKMAAVTDNVTSVFSRDKSGGITGLAGVDPALKGAPTIQDVAARLPRYLDSLSEAQQTAITDMKGVFEQYKQSLTDVGVDVGTRPDVVEGGFYIPRGRADLEGADMPVKVIAGRGQGTRPGAEKAMQFAAQSEGISNGFEYANIKDAVQAYGKTEGKRIVDAHIANYFKGLTDAEGNLIGQTAADRIDPALRAQVEDLRAKITGRSDTLQNQTVRGKAQTAEAGRRVQDVTRMTGRVGTSETKNAAVGTAAEQGTLYGDVGEAIGAARAELKTLRQEQTYTGKRAGEAATRAGQTTAKQKVTAETLQSYQDQLDALASRWDKAKTTALQTPRGQGYIGIPGLEQTSFPDEIANSMNKYLRNEGPVRGTASEVLQVLNTISGLHRSATSTLDNSAIGIQGLLGAASDPKAWATGVKTSFMAWGPDGERLLGAFIKNFDREAVARGLNKTDSWIRSGLHIGGSESEYQLGQGLPDIVSNLPLIKQANRAFGYMGDTLRLNWANDLLQQEITRGRTLAEITASGDLDKIANIANNMTGWSKGKTFSSMGDLLLYAPRFFQSRLETVAKGAMGLMPGATVEERIARQSLLKLIGTGTVTTIGINAMLGEETDLRPIVDGQWNPNFMKIRALGRDFSVFGPWDSLARMMVTTASGHPEQALRGVASGPVAWAWDFISGKDYMGNKTTDNPVDFGAYILRQFTPFAVQNAWQSGGQVASGITQEDTGKAVSAGVVAGIQTLGVKSNPLSMTDIRDEIARKTYGQSYESLGVTDRLAVNANPELLRSVTQPRLTTYGEYQKFMAVADQTNKEFGKIRTVAKLGIKLGQVGDSIKNMPLSNDERILYQKRVLHIVVPHIMDTIGDPRFVSMTPSQRQDILAVIMSKSREQARGEVMSIISKEEVGRRLDAAKAAENATLEAAVAR